MFRTARHPLGTLVLLILLVPSITGCATTRLTPFDSNLAGMDHITGVTMHSGQKIRFAHPGASITNDTMYAVASQGQVLLPTDSIAQVWNRKFSPVRTAGLVGGVAVAAIGVLVAAVAISFSNSFKLAEGPRF
jgi:hypothetical protein